MSQAHADDKLVSIRARFGMWGIGVYWTLVERVAEQMKGGVDTVPAASFFVPELCSFFGCKQNKLEMFCDHLRNIRGMKAKLNGNVLEIEIPKLLELRDNHTRNLQVACKRVSPEGEGEREKEKKKTIRARARGPRAPATPDPINPVNESFRLRASELVELYVRSFEAQGRVWPAGFATAAAKRQAVRNCARLLESGVISEERLRAVVVDATRQMAGWSTSNPYKVSNFFGQAAYWKLFLGGGENGRGKYGAPAAERFADPELGGEV